MDVEKMIAQERRSIVYDSLLAGLFIACIGVHAMLGFSGWSLVPAFFLGSRLKQVGSRFRVIEWMGLVQRQDAVIEQLLTQVESIPLPEQRSRDRVDFV